MKRFTAFLLASLQILPPSLNAQPLATLPTSCRLGSIFEGARCRVPAQDDPLCKQDGLKKTGCVDWQKHYQDTGKKNIQNPKPQLFQKTEDKKPSETKSVGFWRGVDRFVGGILNALLNLFKLALFAPLSIISNIAEGIISGISAIAKGDILGAITWPAKVALNAAWNTFMAGANAINIASDPLWRMMKPKGDEDIAVDLVGAGDRIRTQVTGGPWSYLHKICQKDAVAYVLSSAFIQSHKRDLGTTILSHEIGHTLQIQDSYLADMAVRRTIQGKEGSVEKEADALGHQIQDSVWSGSKLTDDRH